MRFTDRVAIITAAASGIGCATADIMAREGAIVIAVDIDEGRLDATVAALRAAGGRAHGRRADVLDAAQVERARRFRDAGVWRHRHPGQRGRRQHDHPASRRNDGSADPRRLAAADRVQPRRHVSVLPRGGADHEAPAQRQDRAAFLDRRTRSQRVEQCRLCRGQGRYSSPLPARSPSSGGPFGINVNAIAPSRTLTERIRPRWEQQSPEDQAAEIDARHCVVSPKPPTKQR